MYATVWALMSNLPVPFIVRKLRGNPGKRAKRAYERGKDALDFERAGHRARAAIDFIEARATDIAPNLNGGANVENAPW